MDGVVIFFSATLSPSIKNPLVPCRATLSPKSNRKEYIPAVTVVFPFVPVTPTTFKLSKPHFNINSFGVIYLTALSNLSKYTLFCSR